MPKVKVEKLPVVNQNQPVVSQVSILGVTAAAAPALRRLVFVAPYDLTLVGASITPYATITKDGLNYWSFKLTNSTGLVDLTAARTTETVDLTAGTEASLAPVAAEAALAAGAPVYLTMTDTGAPTDLDASSFIVSIKYQPR